MPPPLPKRKMMASLSASASAPSAIAQELWQGSNVGDTIEDILSKFLDAEKLAEPMAYSDGNAAEIIIDQRKIGSDIFDVRFIMSNGGLDSVALVLGVLSV